MSILRRLRARLAPRRGDGERGVTAVEYGVMLTVFAAGMIGIVAFLVNSTSASYNAAETRVADPRAACIGDEIYDSDFGRCFANPMRIATVAPPVGPPSGGTAITITGKSFAALGFVSVTLDGVAASVSSVNSDGTVIVAVTPPGAIGYADVTVTNALTGPPSEIAGISATGFGLFAYSSIPNAPAAPTGVAGNATIGVSWAAPTNTGGIPIIEYTLERSTDGVTWGDAVTSTSTTYQALGLTNGVSYYFRVKAKNAIGYGSFSPASAPITPVAAPPAAPTAPTGVGGNAQVLVSWAAPVDGGSPITDYQIQYSTSSSGPWTTFNDGTSTATSANVTGLSNGTTYYFQVAARNVVGWGAFSPPSLGVAPELSAPSTPAPPTGTPGVGQVVVNWTAPEAGVTGYQVRYGPSATFNAGTWTTLPAGGATTSTTVTGLTNGTPYYFQVRAGNSVGWSSYSGSSAAVTPAGLPSAPAAPTGTAGNAQVVVTWTAPANGGSAITDYTIQYSTTATGPWTTFADGVSTATSATVTGLANGTTYYFHVAATNPVGTGAYSPSSAGVAPRSAAAPDPPTNVTAMSPSGGRITVSWTASVNNGSPITAYRLDRATVSQSTTCSAASFGNQVTTLSTSYAFTNLSSSSWYCFRVRAENAIGNSSYVYVGPIYGQATSPDDPRNVTATSTASGSITVSWLPPLYDGGSPITEYRVRRLAVSGSGTNCSTASGTWSSDYTTGTSYTYTGLNTSTWYCFRVRAYNAVDNSNYVYVGPVLASPPPPGPPRSLDTSSAISGSLALAWLAPLDDGGSAITRYRVDIVGVANGTVNCATTNYNGSTYYPTSTSTTLTGLTPTAWYCVEVRAENANGQSDYIYAGPVKPRPPTAPGAPTSVTGVRGNAQVALSWVEPVDDGGSPIIGYQIERRAGSGGTWVIAVADTGSSATSRTITGLTNGTTYYFRVAAINAIDTGPVSAVSAGITPAVATVPGAPTSLTVADGGRNIADLAWSAPADDGGSSIIDYTVEYVGTNNGQCLTSGWQTQAANVTGTSVTTSSYSGSRCFRVTARNAVGSGAASNVAGPMNP